MESEPTPLLHRPIVLAEVIGLIMEQCQEHCWTIHSSLPSINNPDRLHVAHIRDNAVNAIGMGMSPESNALAMAEAFRSA
jgi:hypothetical protein